MSKKYVNTPRGIMDTDSLAKLSDSTPTQSPTPEALKAAERVCECLDRNPESWNEDVARLIDESTNLPALKKVVEAARGVLEVQSRYSSELATREATRRQFKILRAALDEAKL